MSEIHVVLDSTAHVGKDVLERYPNLHVVPLQVTLGEQRWLEDALSNDELFSIMKNTKLFPKTSQPAPGQFLEVLAPLSQQGHVVIIITMSGALSGTIQSAKTALTMLERKNIYLIDSGTTAIGMLKMAETVFEMAEKGMSVSDIMGRLHDIIQVTHTMFIPASLEHLYKDGRIGGAAALFGSILNIKPILHLVEGKVMVLNKVRTSAKAIALMLDELEKYKPFAYIGVVYIGDHQAGEALAKSVRERYPNTAVSLSTGGPVLGAHLGYGLVGLIFQQRIE
jgi:DegV family protein with EDD domain